MRRELNKPTILKIEGKEYPLIWEPKYTSSEGAYYCPELNFYFQKMVSGNYKVYKPHECERECPTSPCIGCGEYGYWEEEPNDIDICYGSSEEDLPEREPEDLCGGDFNCEPPTCEECGQLDCICLEEPERPEEPEPECPEEEEPIICYDPEEPQEEDHE